MQQMGLCTEQMWTVKRKESIQMITDGVVVGGRMDADWEEERWSRNTQIPHQEL